MPYPFFKRASREKRERAVRRILDIIWLITVTELKQRYSGSVLGLVWVLLKPLFLFLILYIVFSRIFASNEHLYGLKLLSALLTWNFFAEASMLGMTTLVAHGNILSKVSVPKWIFIVTSTLSAWINYAMGFVVLFIVGLLSGVVLGPVEIGSLIAASGAALVLAVAVGLISAPLYVRWRDLNQIWEVLLSAGFFFSPILFPLVLIPKTYQRFVILNPLAYVIAFVKSAVTGQSFTAGHELKISAAVIAVLFIGALLLFRRTAPRSTEYL